MSACATVRRDCVAVVVCFLAWGGVSYFAADVEKIVLSSGSGSTRSGRQRG